jgi:hypothetical protein
MMILRAPSADRIDRLSVAAFLVNEKVEEGLMSNTNHHQKTQARREATTIARQALSK